MSSRAPSTNFLIQLVIKASPLRKKLGTTLRTVPHVRHTRTDRPRRTHLHTTAGVHRTAAGGAAALPLLFPVRFWDGARLTAQKHARGREPAAALGGPVLPVGADFGAAAHAPAARTAGARARHSRGALFDHR